MTSPHTSDIAKILHHETTHAACVCPKCTGQRNTHTSGCTCDGCYVDLLHNATHTMTSAASTSRSDISKALLKLLADLPLESTLAETKALLHHLHTSVAAMVHSHHTAEVHTRVAELAAQAAAGDESTDLDHAEDLLDESIDIVAEIEYWAFKG